MFVDKKFVVPYRYKGVVGRRFVEFLDFKDAQDWFLKHSKDTNKIVYSIETVYLNG